VTGVDPSPRLLAVARERAAARGLAVTFAAGEAAALPLADGDADAVLSVFGVIFASDPRAAAAELARVSAPAGRIVLSAWIPSGAMHEIARAGAQAVSDALGARNPPPFPWHDQHALAGLFAASGFHVTTEEHRLAFTAPSPRAYLDEQANHPQAVAGRAILGPARGDALHERMLATLHAHNEDPNAFRVTSRYVVATAQRPG
jgi:SAM-dependent methyltransferase